MMVTLKLVRNNLKRFFSEKNTIFIYIILPVLILGIMIKFMGNNEGKTSIVVADQDNSQLSQKYVEYLKENKQLKITEITLTTDENDMNEDNNVYTEEYLQNAIKDLQMSTYIKIMKGFEEKFYTDQDVLIQAYGLNESQSLLTIKQLNNTFFSNITGLYIGSGKHISKFNELMEEFKKKEFTLISQYAIENKNSGNMTYAIGILVYFILLASFKISKLAIEDKVSRVYHRIFTMPVKPKHYISGYIVSTFSLVFIQIILSMIVLSVLNTGTVPIMDITIVLSVFAICATSISLLIIAVVNRQNALEIITYGIGMFTSMLAGIFWPVDIMPSFMQKLAMLFPQFWASDAIKGLFFGETLLNKQLNLIIIGGMAVFFFILAGYFMRVNDDLRDAH